MWAGAAPMVVCRISMDDGDARAVGAWNMEIGIVGSGNIGSLLARRFAALKHRVFIANSRGPGSLAALAAEAGVTPATVEQAALATDSACVAPVRENGRNSWRPRPAG